ncbi:MAG: DUF2336 domain-containing protein [Betaproteobacteria bacterium]
MTAATSLIPGLDDIVRGGDPERCAEAARRIAELFLQDAAKLRPAHVDLFDGLLTDLVPHADTKERAELAGRLALLANAPRTLVGQLARENEILVAGPLLRRSPVLDERTLLDIASARGQGHLLAMSERPLLSTALTDVIIRRGDRDVVRRAAGNAGAQFSENGYSELILRANRDGVLTLTVGQRHDLSDRHLKDLLAGSIDAVRRRLFDVVNAERQGAIRQAMADIANAAERVENRRDFGLAQRTILSLYAAGGLTEGAVLGFAKAWRYEEAVASLAAMSGVKIATLDRLLSGDRHDPILILGKTIGFDWATVRALILLRYGPNQSPSPADLEAARANFGRLTQSTAERVVNFWKSRSAA